MTEDEKIRKNAEDYKPEPDKDGEVHSEHKGEEVKVENGHATPTEETVRKALEKQAEGDEAAKEAARDAQAAAEGKKEEPNVTASGSKSDPEQATKTDAQEPAQKAAETQDAAKEQTAEAQDAAAEKPKPKAVAEDDPERAEKIRRAQEARAARAAAAGKAADGAAERPARQRPAKSAEGGDAEPPKPKEPSKNQPFLDKLVALIGELVGPDAIEEAQINEKNGEMPTITVRPEHWLRTAEVLKMNPEISMNYLRLLAGVDQETHLEVVYQMINLSTQREVCVKVKTDRDNPSIPSVTPIWATANWNEREVYDLFGIDFPGHPDLRRIMMPDDWVGHPLRKDYEPLDPEV